MSSAGASATTNWLGITSNCERMPCLPRLVVPRRRVWRCFYEKE
jgi:hypothetical protein